MPSVMQMARELELGSGSNDLSPTLSCDSDESGRESPPFQEKALKTSSSWETRLPSSPVTPLSRSRSPSPPLVHTPEEHVRPASLTIRPEAVTSGFGGHGPIRAEPAGGALSRPAQARRMMSNMCTYDSRGPPQRNNPMIRQLSENSRSSHTSREGRMSSFSGLFTSRKDSIDSYVSIAASEPVSYSNNLYVANDIWLTEKKLDSVEANVATQEEEKRKRRSKAADPFSADAEGQNFSSRLVGLLWSAPISSNPRGNPDRGSRRSQRRGLRRERGTLGTSHCEELADNMPGAFPHVKSSTKVSGSPPVRREPIFDEKPLHQPSHYNSAKRVMRRADPARWLRRRAHRRHERRDGVW